MMAQLRLIVNGVIRDQSGNAIENARVWIASGPSDCVDIAILTDARGEFVITVPAVGKYEIASIADGYNVHRQVVDVAVETSSFVEIRLRTS